MSTLFSVRADTKYERVFLFDLNNPYCITVYELTNNGFEFVKTYNTTSIKYVKKSIAEYCGCNLYREIKKGESNDSRYFRFTRFR